MGNTCILLNGMGMWFFMRKERYKVMECVLLCSTFWMVFSGQGKAKTGAGNRPVVRQNTHVGKNRVSQKGILDLSVLPVIRGNVAQYLPTPYGNLGGLLLTDGTQVMFSTQFGEQVRAFVHPGQRMAIQGLKAYSLPFVQAFQFINQHGERIQEDSPDTDLSPVPVTGPDLSVNGTIRQMLYTLQGQVMGMVLTDGTVIYIRASDVKKLDFTLKPGVTVYVQGIGSINGLGKALQVRTIGQSERTAVELSRFNAPPAGAPAGSPLYDYIPE